MDPAAVVQRQVDAYNAHDLDRFLDCYSTDATVMTGADKVLAQGQVEIRAMYGRLFAEHSTLHAHIPNRIHVGEWVIDEEHLARTTVEGAPHELRAAVVYRVLDGKIVRSQVLL